MAALEMGGKQYISNGWEKDWVWKQACLRGSQEAFRLGATSCYALIVGEIMMHELFTMNATLFCI
jgi:hypothetical protein